MQVQFNRKKLEKWDGQWKPETLRGEYICSCRHEERISPDCPRHVSQGEADAEVWRQVSAAINQPDTLIEQARRIIDELREKASLFDSEKERLEKAISNLFLDRQWVITQLRKGMMTAAEMESRLKEMSIQEVRLKGELNSLKETIDEHLLNGWEDRVREFLDDLREGFAVLDGTSDSPEEQGQILLLKRRTIEMLVEKVVVDRNRQYEVTIRLDLLNLLENSGSPQGSSGSSGGSLPTGHPGKNFVFAGRRQVRKSYFRTCQDHRSPVKGFLEHNHEKTRCYLYSYILGASGRKVQSIGAGI